MKNKLMIMGITIILMLTVAVTSYAATSPVVGLQTDGFNVEVGETFTVTLWVESTEGINGVDTKYSYDTEKLELISANVADSKFANLGTDNQITVINNSTEKIEKADIFILTFKVKDGVQVGSTAKVSISETLVDTDAETNSEHTLQGQELTFSVVETLSSNNGTGDGFGTGTGDESGTGTGDGSGTGDGEQEVPPTDNEQENPPVDDENGNNEEDVLGNNGDGDTIVQVGDDEEIDNDETISDKEYSKAGLSTILAFGIVVIILVSIIMYIKNKKYQDIK